MFRPEYVPSFKAGLAGFAIMTFTCMMAMEVGFQLNTSFILGVFAALASIYFVDKHNIYDTRDYIPAEIREARAELIQYHRALLTKRTLLLVCGAVATFAFAPQLGSLLIHVCPAPICMDIAFRFFIQYPLVVPSLLILVVFLFGPKYPKDAHKLLTESTSEPSSEFTNGSTPQPSSNPLASAFKPVGTVFSALGGGVREILLMVGGFSGIALVLVLLFTASDSSPSYSNSGVLLTGAGFLIFLVLYVSERGLGPLMYSLTYTAGGTIALHLLISIVSVVSSGGSFESVVFSPTRFFYAFLIGLFFFVIMVTKNFNDRPLQDPQREPYRGSGLLSFEEGMRRLLALIKPELPGVVFGPSPVPYDMEPEHFLLVGTTGAGKTNQVKVLLAGLAERIGSPLYPKNSATILDPKREFLSVLVPHVQLANNPKKPNIVLFDLFDKRSSYWDIARDIRSTDDCKDIAAVLIPEDTGNQSRIWIEAPRTMTTDVIDGLWRTCGNNWRFRDLVIILQKLPLMKHFISQVPLPDSREMLDMAETTAGFYATFLTYVRKYNQAAAAMDWLYGHKGPQAGVSLNDHGEHEEIILVVNDPDHEKTTLPINAAILGRLATVLRSQPDAKTAMTTNSKGKKVEPRHFFVVDEAARMDQIPGLTDLLTEGRSRGVCCLIAFQSPFGMYKTYGDTQTHDIVSLCNCRGIMRNDVKAAREIAEWFSDYPTKDWTFSQSHSNDGNTTSESVNFGREYMIEAREIAELPHASTGQVGGFWQYRGIPPFKAIQTMAHFEKLIFKPQRYFMAENKIHDEIPETERHLELLPFDESDYRRLGIPEELWDVPGAKTPAPEKPAANKERPVAEPEARDGNTAKQTKFCPSCGEANQPQARFCANCGKPFPGTPSPASQPPRTNIFDDI